MNDQHDTEQRPAGPRDDRAWREAMQRVTGRNDQARKAGKQQRAAHERWLAARRAERRDLYR